MSKALFIRVDPSSPLEWVNLAATDLGAFLGGEPYEAFRDDGAVGYCISQCYEAREPVNHRATKALDRPTYGPLLVCGFDGTQMTDLPAEHEEWIRDRCS
jgi:hypothetical protein